MITEQTDRIERHIQIEAPRARVWQALGNAEEFGKWFGVNLQGQQFAPGKQVRGRITHKGYEHIMFDAAVERLEPQSMLSFRWHPGAVDPAFDYSKEERTLVTFTLTDAGTGTLLTVVESGFEKLPPGRRAEAFEGNSAGWDEQVKNIRAHVTGR